MAKGFLRHLELAAPPVFLSRIEEHENFFLLHFKGAVDMHTLSAGRFRMLRIIKNHNLHGKNILCDLSQVTHADTACIAAMIERLSAMRRHGKRLILLHVPAVIRTFIRIARVEPLFEICDTPEDAAGVFA